MKKKTGSSGHWIKHREYTARLGKILTRTLSEKVNVDAEVFYDHGGKKKTNIFQAVPYFEKYCAATTLSHADLVIISQGQREITLCEIEEEDTDLTTIIGDVVSLFLAEGLRMNHEDLWFKDFDRINLILGIIRRTSRTEDKTMELIHRIKQIIKPELSEKVNIQMISGRDHEQLIVNLERTSLAMLGIIG